jgi:hypothetical protein
VLLPGSPKLIFLQQPTSTVAGNAVSPAVRVEVEDKTGKVLTANTAVTLSLASGASGATLNQTVKAVNGIATFSNVVLNLASTNYKLEAADLGVISAASNVFSITAAAASKLVFGALPTGTVVGKAIASAITVSVEDKFGNLVAVSGSKLSLAIASGPTGGAIKGTVSVAPVNGKAAFGGLSFTLPGSYKIKATDGTLTATSGAIAVGVANVTAQVSITKAAFVVNSKTGQYSQVVTVKNISTTSTTGPLELLLGSLTTGVTVANTHGSTTVITPIGTPYVLLGTAASVLQAGQSLSITLLFNNAKKLSISYAAALYAGSSTL